MSRLSTPAEFQTASITRVRDYWLGGHDSFAADREMAARIEAAYPPPRSGEDPEPAPRRMTWCAQAFLGRAVTYAAKQGVSQFVHLAAGYPPPRRACAMTHETARDVTPDARCVYVDADEVAVSHVRAATAGTAGVTAIAADYAEPGDVLRYVTSEALQDRGRIDLGRPVAVLLPMALQFMTARRAREVCGAYVEALVPGSFLVLSVPHCDPPPSDPQLWERIRTAYTSGMAFNHGPADVEKLFEGTKLVDPGVVPARGWQGGWGDSLPPDSVAFVLCGAGVKQ